MPCKWSICEAYFSVLTLIYTRAQQIQNQMKTEKKYKDSVLWGVTKETANMNTTKEKRLQELTENCGLG